MGKHKKISQQPKSIPEAIHETIPEAIHEAIHEAIPEEPTPSVLSLLLADSIFVFHCIIILFVIFAPFINIPAILILHITFVFSLIVHWRANSNVCSLSIFEAHLRGLDTREDTFTHQFIAPVYDISATEWSNIVWIITSVALCISIYKLYNTDKFKIAWKCYSESSSKTTIYSKTSHFLACFKPLFIID
jgi:hypothetical protein